MPHPGHTCRALALAVAPCALFAGASHGAIYSHALSMDSLPGAQGYSYFGINSSLTEAQVYSVSDGVLTMNSMGNGYQGQGSNSEHMAVAAGQYEEGLDAVLEARVRVIDGERLSFHYGFYLGLWFDGMYANVGIMPTTIQNGTLSQIISRDNAQWTDWKLETDRANDVYRVYADGTLVFTDALLAAVGSPGWDLPDNFFAFGDGTGGANAEAQVSSLSFRQVSTQAPAPGVGAAILVGSGVLLRRRRMV